VVLGDRQDLMRRELTASGTNWLVEIPDCPQRCFAQIRYNAPAASATMERLADARLWVEFDEPQFGVAPGQAVVCYDAPHNQRVLCGGWIE
jgi:tRNA-specific 2-thiouridylase